MNNYGELTGPETLRFERLLPGPIERVWEYLTDSEKRGKWLASGEMELKQGGKVEFQFNHKELSPLPDPVPEKYNEFENGHHSKGKVLEIEPPHLLKFTWDNEGDVTIKLSEEGEMVRLMLIHEKLGSRENIIGASAGWHTHLNIMVDRLKGNDPKGFWAVHMPLEEEYKQRLGF